MLSMHNEPTAPVEREDIQQEKPRKSARFRASIARDSIISVEAFDDGLPEDEDPTQHGECSYSTPLSVTWKFDQAMAEVQKALFILREVHLSEFRNIGATNGIFEQGMDVAKLGKTQSQLLCLPKDMMSQWRSPHVMWKEGDSPSNQDGALVRGASADVLRGTSSKTLSSVPQTIDENSRSTSFTDKSSKQLKARSGTGDTVGRVRSNATNATDVGKGLRSIAPQKGAQAERSVSHGLGYSVRVSLHQIWCPPEERVEEVLSSIRYQSVFIPSETKLFREAIRTKYLHVRSRSSVTNIRRSNQHGLIHPESKGRMAWDFLALSCILYDCVTVPLQVFGYEGARVVDWIIAIFWTLDVIASLVTGAYVKGELVMRFREVFVNYSKTWLGFDVCMAVSEWIFLVNEHLSGSEASQASVTSLRSIRSFRFLRILRIVKVRKVISSVQKTINSIYFLLIFDILQHLVVIIFANHMIASLWFLLGNSSGAGWVAASDIDHRQPLYKYLTSLHWSISQFHGSMEVAPQNKRERAFAVTILLLGLITFSLFVSSVTQSMVELRRCHKERNTQNRLLHKYLQERNVSMALSARIKIFMKYTNKHEEHEQLDEKRIAALSKLPKNMLMDLHAEARTGLLKTRVLYHDLQERVSGVMRHICHDAICEVTFGADHRAFSTGDLIASASIVEQGSLRYTPHANLGLQECIVRKQSWLCEPVLFMNWVCNGCLTCQTFVNCLQIDSDRFAAVICKHETAYIMTCLYASKLCQEVQQGNLSDVEDYHIVFYMNRRGSEPEASAEAISTGTSNRSNTSTGQTEHVSMSQRITDTLFRVQSKKSMT